MATLLTPDRIRRTQRHLRITLSTPIIYHRSPSRSARIPTITSDAAEPGRRGRGLVEGAARTAAAGTAAGEVAGLGGRGR